MADSIASPSSASAPGSAPAESMSSSLKVASFQSFVDSAFFHDLASRKLDEIMLDEGEIPVTAAYNVPMAAGRQPSLAVSKTSLAGSGMQGRGKAEVEVKTIPQEFTAKGTLVGLNTIEAFKSYDKNAVLRAKVEQVS